MPSLDHGKFGVTEADLVYLKAHLGLDVKELIQASHIISVAGQYNKGELVDPKIISIIGKYDADKNGKIDCKELLKMEKEYGDLQDSKARYLSYSAGLARVFRYLAFTSDFGEAMRPVVSARIVNASYGVAIGYCVADIGWEAYKLHERGYVDTKGHPRSMTQQLVERSTFQLVASITVPFLVIHNTVDIGKKVCKKIGRFQKFGPSILGLSMVPMLPLVVDEPVESALEYVFEHYGPWAQFKSKTD
jgi:fission process protein 1